ncbi:hypothetical protein MAPG_00550 [Magnaporthiopsis poae ATCC 64411]|uniref:Hsp70-like protein n=1 Tax=Magnaporthiopsis poae (strain ATCC 64411 / 73-15) TaxID=644358 RepID=A0A0C4DLA9_MAGP6|nr:hypothetical protein MAPG_00550 [Magnaporthiopsis poae ATCC 64411]
MPSWSKHQKPHAIVGLDFGMECIKVAMAFLDEASNDYKVMLLPFKENSFTDETNNLTVLAYPSAGGGPEWGYAADALTGHRDWHVFRILDPGALDPLSVTRQLNCVLCTPCLDTQVQVLSDTVEHPTDVVAAAAGPALNKTGRELCLDVLKKLLPCIVDFYTENARARLPAWDDARVDVVLTVPLTVGKDRGTVLAEAARDAGFEDAEKKHKVLDVSLTEAEAVMVQIMHEKGDLFMTGDHILVADIGGATLDTSLLVLADKEKGQVLTDFWWPMTNQLFGAAYIDDALEKNIAQALKQCNAQGSPAVAADIAGVARSLSRDFSVRHAKHSLGKRVSDPDSVASKEVACVPIPSLLDGVLTSSLGENRGITFQDTLMQLNRPALTDLFDRQIHGEPGKCHGLTVEMRIMRDDVYVKHAAKSIRHPPRERDAGQAPRANDILDFLVFAGGMGANEYVRTEIEDALRHRPPHPPASQPDIQSAKTIEDMQYLAAESPQHCVCQGLVRAHMQELDNRKKRSSFLFKKPGFMKRK